MNAASPSPNRFPPSVYEEQDIIFAVPFEILRVAVADHAFPGVSAAVVHRGNLIAFKAFGTFTYEANSPQILLSSIFDLASVSKVVATTITAMILYERGLLDIEAPVDAILPEFASSDPRRGSVTVRMLLAHSSGLPAYEKLFLRASTRDELLTLALQTNLTADPGTRHEYSDIGFIILGLLLERVADESLQGFCQREIFGKLGMTETIFNPPMTLRNSIPPTADDVSFRHRIIQGEVQDENASVLGGVAGHAGIFASAGDMAIFAHCMLHLGSPLVRAETFKFFTKRQSAPEGTSRALGWDTPSRPSQSGKYLSPDSFGHLGYTGTSLWIDPARQLAIILLANRTWPDCSNQKIKKIRPAFHDGVIESLNLVDVP